MKTHGLYICACCKW